MSVGYRFRYPCLLGAFPFGCWVSFSIPVFACGLFLLGAGYRFRYPCWFLLIAFLLWKLPLLSRRNHSGGYRGGRSALTGGAPVGRLMGSALSSQFIFSTFSVAKRYTAQSSPPSRYRRAGRCHGSSGYGDWHRCYRPKSRCCRRKYSSM